MFKFLSSKFKTKKWQLIASSFGVVVAICLMFVAVSGYAWFSNNKEVKASGMAVVAKYPDFIEIEGYEVYKINADNGEIFLASSNLDPQPIELNEYDYVLTEKNVSTPVIIRIVINRVLETKSGIFIDMSNPNELGENENMNEYASNICSIRAKYGEIYENGSKKYDTNIEEMNAVFTEFAEDTTTQYNSFLSVERSGDTFTNTKTTEETIELSSYDDYVYEEDDKNKLVLYIEITYNHDLIDEYNLQNTGELDSLEDMEMNIAFDYDIEAFVLGYIA